MPYEPSAKPASQRGQGRKPTSPTGQPMRPHKIRMTDSDWEDAKMIGMEKIRAWIRKTAIRLRERATR